MFLFYCTFDYYTYYVVIVDVDGDREDFTTCNNFFYLYGWILALFSYSLILLSTHLFLILQLS